MGAASKSFPRTVGLEPQFAELLPEVLLGIGPDQFAAMAALALAPKPIEEVGLGHIHVQRVSVREQAAIIVERLRRVGTTTFRALTQDCDTTLLIVGRFLALLELYREQAVLFEQISPLGDLTVRWVGQNDGEINVTDEFDVERDVDAETDADEIAIEETGEVDE